MKKLKVINFIALLVGIIAFTSCEKEESLLQSTASGNIPTFSSVEEYTTKLNKIANMTFDELCEYENSIGFYSLGRKSDEIYTKANPENFNTVEEFVKFVESNSNYIELITNSNKETTLEIKSGYNSNRYLVGEDGLFRINNTLYKVINNFTIYTGDNNIEKIKKINTSNYHEYLDDSDIKFPIHIKQPESKTTAQYYHKTNEAVDGSNKTKIFVTMWGCDHYQQNDTYLQCDFVVRPYKRTLGIWYYCSRTLSWDIDAKVVSHFGNDVWAGWLIDESESGIHDSYRSHTWDVWLDNGLDGGGYSVIQCCYFDWLHFWGTSPDAGPTRIDIY